MIALYCKQGSADDKIYIDVACNGNIVNGLMYAAIFVIRFFDLHFFIFSMSSMDSMVQVYFTTWIPGIIAYPLSSQFIKI